MRVGSVVNTSQLPFPGSQPAENVEGRAPVGVPMVHTYDAEKLSGPFMTARSVGRRGLPPTKPSLKLLGHGECYVIPPGPRDDLHPDGQPFG